MMDLRDGDDLTDEDLKAMSSLPPHLQSSSFSQEVPILTYDKSQPENSNVPSPIWITGLCEPHQRLSVRLVKPTFDNLFGLIFYPPPPLGPVLHRTGFAMVIAGMRAVINKKYNENYRRLDESVFIPCMGCGCRKLLSEDQFIYTILLCISILHRPPVNRRLYYFRKYLGSIPSLRTDFTTQDVSLRVNSTLEESQALRLEIFKSNIEIEYVEIDAPDPCLA